MAMDRALMQFNYGISQLAEWALKDKSNTAKRDQYFVQVELSQTNMNGIYDTDNQSGELDHAIVQTYDDWKEYLAIDADAMEVIDATDPADRSADDQAQLIRYKALKNRYGE